MTNRVDVKYIIAASFVVTLAAGSVAGAHDHRPPRATLRVGGDVREGSFHHGDGWAHAAEEPGYCYMDFLSGFPRFSKPLKHDVGEEIVVRLHKRAMPLEVEAQRWPRVDQHDRPAGTPTSVPWVLRPYVVDGATKAWEVVILPPLVQGHLYLGVGAYWADEDGCSGGVDLGSQYAAWTFHVVGR